MFVREDHHRLSRQCQKWKAKPSTSPLLARARLSREVCFMSVVICSVAWGGWYRKGLERQIREFERVSPGYELQAWLNVLPPGTPVLIKDGVDYTGYAA